MAGKVVFGAGLFASLDDSVLPPAMPDWSPVRRFGGFAAWGDDEASPTTAAFRKMAAHACGCLDACTLHGHDHAAAWSRRLPVSDPKRFWGALGCACWAV